MKTTKRIFLFAFSLLLLSSASTLNAQVTIGSEKVPETYSILELASTTGGFRLPQLSTAQRNALSVSGKVLAKGLMVYNTDIDCTETWNGATWVSNCGTESSTFQITRHPDAFFDIDFNTDATIYLSVVAEGSGTLKYQWYKQTMADQLAGNVPEIINGATERTYTLSVVASADRSNTRYFCEVTNDIETKQSDNARVLVGGCGAYIDGGVWLKFMCHNLGADETADPFTPSARIHGAKYKWGTTKPALTQEQDQYSYDMINGWPAITPPKATAWDMINDNPCPSGWRVPTKIECEQIFNATNNILTRVPDVPTAWTFSNTNYATGIKVGNDLFLPASGNRGSGAGNLSARGSYGHYWASEQEGTTPARMTLGYELASVIFYGPKMFGFAIRCVAND